MRKIVIKTEPVHKEIYSCFDCPHFIKLSGKYPKDHDDIGRCKHPKFIEEITLKYGECSYNRLNKLTSIKIWELYGGFPKYCKLEYIVETETKRDP